MTTQWERIAPEGFRFFGKMSASISHEIKNALAIINENAGLLEDLTLLAEQGRPTDPQRLKKLAQSIKKQIQRADGLVKRMNRFAHSADETEKTVDLGELLELIMAMAQRLASQREARLELILPEEPVRTGTNPFLLENLIWLCLDHLLAEGHKAIRLVPEEAADGARIRLLGQFEFPADSTAVFPSPREKALLEALGAELRLEAKAGEIVLRLLKTI
jgi:signal transduction histidine kinase